MNNNLETINDEILEIHYYFANNSHSIDASVRNRCESEILSIIREVASIFEIRITIETEPIGEGGLRQWLKIISRDENKKASISTGIITALVTVILITPLTKITEKIVENLFEDTELRILEKQKLKLEIEKLKQDTRITSGVINNNNVIKKKKSNFYQILNNYPKVEKVSFSVVDSNKIKIIEERFVNKMSFEEFILKSNELELINEQEATIEIISPVLKKGNYKWMGMYNNQPVHFSMKSNEFKSLVQNGEIEFKNGSSINCYLQIKREMDNEGQEKIVSYDVIRVNRYFQNYQPIETNEGKRYMQKKEANMNQLKLDFKSSNQ